MPYFFQFNINLEMQSLKESDITQIKAIPNLFISDHFTPGWESSLRSLKIRYILSVTHSEEVPKFISVSSEDTTGAEQEFLVKHIDIQDDPTEDILVHLRGACDWISSCLAESEGGKGGVLVLSTQGTSRSGAVIVAYLMRTLSLPYLEALGLLRESSVAVSPNPGFETQLRLWEDCGYDVFMGERREGTEGSQERAGEEKSAYRVWKQGRDEVVRRREEDASKERFKGIAASAARLRQGKIEGEEGWGEGGSEVLKGEGWERVAKMEEAWRKRGMKGRGCI